MEFTDAAWWSGDEKGTPPVVSPETTRASRYLTMDDGTRLAVDISLPSGLGPDAKIPTLVSFTPYLRGMDFRFSLAEKALAAVGKAEENWGAAFARLGYAHVAIEIRGAGASFGTKRSIFVEELVDDGGQVLDWIVDQPWSNGRVGATGISALGLTSLMLASGKHPALKAIAPRFTVFDTFYCLHPGGLLLNRFVEDIGRDLRAMDSGRLHETMETKLKQKVLQLLIKGVRGVDEDHDGSLLAAAQAEHKDNEGFDRDIAAVRLRDQRLPYSAVDATLDTQSPFRLLPDIIASGVAVYAYGGWLDASFQRDLIHLFMNLDDDRARLILGPWPHGARAYSSPVVEDDRRSSDFDQAAELVRFFDPHLRDIDRRVPGEDRVQYFTMAEEKWKSAPTWPPPNTQTQRMYLGAEQDLGESAAPEESKTRYVVDVAASTGLWSRYGKHLTFGIEGARYPDRAAADKKLSTFTSAPLQEDTEVTGHAIVELTMTCDTDDAALFVYLEDVDPSGKPLVVTDGSQRLSARAEGGEAPYRMAGVWKRGSSEDVQPVVAGETMTIRMDLLPTSWLFRKGHRMRIAVAGADVDNFVMVPEDGRAPTFEILTGGANPSFIDLPIIPRRTV